MRDAHRLRAAGLRVTAARLAILAAVRAGDHLDVEAVTELARQHIGSLSTQTVYEALRALTAAGLVRRIAIDGGPARYEARVGDNHHHLICRRCGSVSDVDCAVGLAPCMQPRSTAGYAVDEAEVTFWGLCPRCRTRDPEPESGGQAHD